MENKQKNKEQEAAQSQSTHVMDGNFKNSPETQILFEGDVVNPREQKRELPKDHRKDNQQQNEQFHHRQWSLGQKPDRIRIR